MPYKIQADAAARLTRWRGRNPEKTKEYVRRWEQKHPWHAKANSAAKQARKRYDGPISPQIVLEVWMSRECYWCGVAVTLNTCSLDHLRRRDGNARANLVTACIECNMWKRTSSPEVFLATVRRIHERHNQSP